VSAEPLEDLRQVELPGVGCEQAARLERVRREDSQLAPRLDELVRVGRVGEDQVYARGLDVLGRAQPAGPD
jgi:hypothetical protein